MECYEGELLCPADSSTKVQGRCLYILLLVFARELTAVTQAVLVLYRKLMVLWTDVLAQTVNMAPYTFLFHTKYGSSG